MGKLRFTALLLVLTLILGGCAFPEGAHGLYDVVAYPDMEYTRPDMTVLEETLSEVCAAAATSQTASGLMDQVYGFYDLYDSVLTNWYLAELRYSADLTDAYWESEYTFCNESIPQLDAFLEQLYRALAASPLRAQLESEYFGEGYFDAYEGESYWDAHYVSLLEEEARLESEYYALSDEALSAEPYSEEYFQTYGPPMAELLVELVALRQEIARYLGYESYAQYAYEGYFYRDYTPQEAETYLCGISSALYDCYTRVTAPGLWDDSYKYCSEEETFAYLKEAATNMGGTVKHAFDLLEKAQLYDISYGENKYDASFTLYLWRYNEPFIFVNPCLDQMDKLVFAHEFGHFLNDYVCYGSYAGTDVAEVHSQAFEYLSLCFTSDSEDLARFKMADSLCTFMECAAYALFEHRLYALAPEDLTVENVAALYEKTCLEFGFDSWNWDSRDFVTVVHFFTEPMYMVSYVVSNDLALQIYQLEHKGISKGLRLYEQILQSQDTYLLAFAETYGLESPFAEGRLEALAETFSEALQ